MARLWGVRALGLMIGHGLGFKIEHGLGFGIVRV